MNGAKTARYPEHHELAELFKFQDVTLKLCSLNIMCRSIRRFVKLKTTER